MLYSGTFSCGHEGKVNIIGKAKDREWKIERAFSNMCPDCYKKWLEEEHQRKNKEAMEEAKEMDLPELTGKQIFERAGFDTSILHDNLPYRRISSWVKNYKKFGIKYFLPEFEPYCSKKKEIKEEPVDKFKLQLLRCVLKRLQEIENEKD